MKTPVKLSTVKKKNQKPLKPFCLEIFLNFGNFGQNFGALLAKTVNWNLKNGAVTDISAKVQLIN